MGTDGRPLATLAAQLIRGARHTVEPDDAMATLAEGEAPVDVGRLIGLEAALIARAHQREGETRGVARETAEEGVAGLRSVRGSGGVAG